MSNRTRTGDDPTNRATNHQTTAAFEGLACGRRRVVFAVLTDRDEPVDTAELATLVAARERGEASSAVSESDRETVRATLVHCHLPKLASLGLVDYDAGEGRVAYRPGVDLESAGLLDVDPAGESDEVDDLFDALADERRRTVLSMLRERRDAVPVESLVGALSGADESDDRTRLSLYHRHLPKLEAVGAISFDAERGRASYTGHPDLRADWLASPPVRTSTNRSRPAVHGQALDD